MSHVLGDAGRAALKVFLGALLVVAIGVSAQSNLNNAVALGIAGLMAAVASAIAAFQVFVPQLSFRAYVPGLLGAALDSFVHAFLATFLVAVTGWLNEPNYSAWKALLIGAIVASLNAGLRAIQGALDPVPAPAPAPAPVTFGVPAGRGVLRGETTHVLLPA